jgi:DNA-binding transcriptional regulator YiaG
LKPLITRGTAILSTRQSTKKSCRFRRGLTQAPLLRVLHGLHAAGLFTGTDGEGAHLGTKPTGSKPISGDEIRSLRKYARLSQAVFARYLNLTVGYVSQLELGSKRPTGPALVSLSVIRCRGIEAIL